MKKLLTLSVFLTLAGVSFAQKNNPFIKGKLVDSLYKESLSEASVSLLNIVDSSLVQYALADKNGQFEMRGINAGKYRLLITFQGYRNYSKEINVEAAGLDLGPIYLDKVTTMLDEVIVERPPITIKKDTIEFSAGAFKTKPNALAEDLLKQLPGVEVDREGNIKAQGEDVKKIYVNGKEFFGNDPKIATKNITADMIESVQVYDDMSEQAKFTRIDDGSRSKTINIKIKKDRNNGYFGRAVAGIGDDGHYDASLSLNKFGGDTRISLIGSSNNLSQQGFSGGGMMGGDMMLGSALSSLSGGMMGGMGGGGRVIVANGGITVMRGMGGGMGGGMGATAGIARSNSGGINYNDRWNDRTDAGGSYFFSNSSRTTEQSRLQQSTFPNDSISVENRDSRSTNTSQNHRFNFRTEFYIDSMNSILYTPGFNYQRSESGNSDTSFTMASNPTLNYLAITGKTQNMNETEGFSLTNDLLYRRRFNKLGRTLTVGFNNSINNNDVNGLNYSPLTFYNPDNSIEKVIDQNLANTQKTRGMTNVLSSSYTEPIGNNKLVEVNFAHSDNRNTSDRKSFNYNGATEKFDEINPEQTNYFENSYITTRLGTNFRLQNEAYSFQVGGSLQSSFLSNHTIEAATGKDTTYKQRFINFSPTANFTYNIARQRSVRFNYQGRPNAPSISQLQEVPDVSNPLQVVTGNRSLAQEFSNRMSVSYSSFDMTTFRMLMVNLSYGNTYNKIVNSIDTLSQGVQIIKPQNANGVYNFSSNVSMGFPLKGKLKGSNFNIGTNISYNRNLSLLYKQKIPTDNWMAGQSASLNLSIKEKLYFDLGANISYNTTRYSEKGSGAQDQEYFTQNYNTGINYIFLSNYTLSSDFNYYVNTGRTNGFDQHIPVWNAGIARTLFKKKNGEIRFSVNDLLNQNQSISRTAYDNNFVDTKSNVQRRYFMLRFTYNLARMGKGSVKPMNRPGGMPVGVPVGVPGGRFNRPGGF